MHWCIRMSALRLYVRMQAGMQVAYVHILAGMHACMYVRIMYVCMYACMHVHTCTNVSRHARIHEGSFAHAHTFTHLGSTPHENKN